MKKLIIIMLILFMGVVPLMTQAYSASMVKILGEDATVTEKDFIFCGSRLAPGGTLWDGCSRRDTNEIEIRSSLPDYRKNEVFYHELGHLLVKSDDVIAQRIFSVDYLKQDGYHDKNWRENMAVYFERFFTGEAEPNIQFAYVGYVFVRQLLKHLIP